MKRQFVFFTLVLTLALVSSCKKESGSTAPPSGGIQETEPNDNTPQALGTLGTSDLAVNGSTANANDVDLYSIVLDSNGNLYVAVSWSGGSDLDLGVMNGSQVMINYQDTGANPERCTLPSLSAGTYILHVTSKTASATSYTLTVGRR